MNFQHGDLYHVFNQGNNRQKIFFTRNNYLFFLTKIKNHILPHADILAWCLMPNHFHLMIYVHTIEVPVNCDGLQNTGESTTGSTTANRISIGSTTTSCTTNKSKATINLNKAIGVILTSYTRAINLQEGRTGSLFKQHTQAECLTTPQGITPTFFNTAFGTQVNVRIAEKEYPQACFNYIHQNPVKAKLVVRSEHWEFSSYPDYCGARNGKLISKKRATELGLIR